MDLEEEQVGSWGTLLISSVIMDRTIVQKHLLQGVKNWNDHIDSNAALDTMVSVLKPYLEENPYDTEMWINLALTEYCVPTADYGAVSDSLNWILKYERNNSKVLLMLAYAQDHHYGVEQETQDRLALAVPSNAEEEALLYMLRPGITETGMIAKGLCNCYNNQYRLIRT